MGRDQRKDLKWAVHERRWGPLVRAGKRWGHEVRTVWRGAALIAVLTIVSGPGCAHTVRRWHEPDATSAVTSVRPSEADPGARNLLDVLQWQVPGLTVTRTANGAASISIRDGSCRSFTNPTGTLADANPLVIIDGMPLPDDPGQVTRELESLRPSRVEKVEVLRDVASTAVYGTRGYCGVIRVSTR